MTPISKSLELDEKDPLIAGFRHPNRNPDKVTLEIASKSGAHFTAL